MHAKTIQGRIRIRTLFLALSVLVIGSNGFAVPQTYLPPSALVPSGFEYGRHTEYAFSEFFPIGWSQDGAFAFLKQGNMGGDCGDCPYFVVTIQNLITDEILWTWQSDIMSETTDTLLAEVWADNAQEIQAELSVHGIEPIDESTGVVFGVGSRLNALDRDYTFQVESQITSIEIANPYGGGSSKREVVEYAEINVTAGNLGKKRIYRESFGTGDKVVELGVAGAVTSDFTPRAAVIVVKAVLNYQLERVLEWQIVGAHLLYGFD